jgi:putative tricarboxylic transport membrane protein
MNKNVLFTGTILVVGVIYWVMALQMPLGSIAYPGPGFYPSAVGGFLIVTAAVCFGIALVGAKKEKPATASSAPEPSKPSYKKLAVSPTMQLLALLVFYAGSLPYLGFPLAVSVLLLLAMRIFGYRRWLRSVLITALIVAVSYVTFVYWLSVPLPRGFLGEYL